MSTTSPARAGIRALVVLVALVGVGVAVARITGVHAPSASPAFWPVVTALLAVGLFASTSSIPLPLRRDELRVVGTAVTVGVVAKAVLIGGVMALALREPALLVLGPVMAQIDPLSVAALQGSSGLSARGRAVLAAWSSFDDPVTALLVVVLGGLAATVAPSGPLADPAGGLLGNAALAAGAGLAWWLLTALRRRLPQRWAGLPWTVLATAVLAGLVAVAVVWFLVLGLAVAGLFFRPPIAALLRGLTPLAFGLAAVVLGLVAAGGVSPWAGLLLGAAAFVAHMAAGSVIARRMPRDRLRLAVGQQSGITAIVLALLLEPTSPGTVAVVAPAILVVNVLHFAANTLLDRRRAQAPPPAVEPGSDPQPTPTACCTSSPSSRTSRTT